MKRLSLHPDFAKFLAVGLLNAAFGYGLFSALIFFHFRDEWAMLVATICGIIFNYNSFGKLVFKDHDGGRFLKFIGVYALIYTGNVIGLKLGHRVGLNSYIGAAILIAPMALASYYLNKKWVFKL